MKVTKILIRAGWMFVASITLLTAGALFASQAVLEHLIKAYDELLTESVRQNDWEKTWSWHRAAFGYGTVQAARQTPDLSYGKQTMGKKYNTAMFAYVSFANPNKQFRAAFEEVFGAAFIHKQAQWLGEETHHYNSATLKIVFNLLYRQPNTHVAGKPLSYYYNKHTRPYVRENLPMLTEMLARPDRLEAYIAETQKFMEADRKQYGAAGVALGMSQVFEKHEFKGDVRLFTAVLRRHNDGTLSELRKMFKTILEDYDPEMYSKYHRRL